MIDWTKPIRNRHYPEWEIKYVGIDPYCPAKRVAMMRDQHGEVEPVSWLENAFENIPEPPLRVKQQFYVYKDGDGYHLARVRSIYTLGTIDIDQEIKPLPEK